MGPIPRAGNHNGSPLTSFLETTLALAIDCDLPYCMNRFCEFPQEIVLAFDRICDIAQVQILSHQAKIAVKIEIYPGLALHGGPVADYKDAEYKRLGYTNTMNILSSSPYLAYTYPCTHTHILIQSI